MFNQIIFQLLMHLSITNSSLNTHHISDICKDIGRIREIHMWTSDVWNIKLSISLVKFLILLFIKFCFHTAIEYEIIININMGFTNLDNLSHLFHPSSRTWFILSSSELLSFTCSLRHWSQNFSHFLRKPKGV